MCHIKYKYGVFHFVVFFCFVNDCIVLSSFVSSSLEREFVFDEDRPLNLEEPVSDFCDLGAAGLWLDRFYFLSFGTLSMPLGGIIALYITELLYMARLLAGGFWV